MVGLLAAGYVLINAVLVFGFDFSFPELRPPPHAQDKRDDQQAQFDCAVQLRHECLYDEWTNRYGALDRVPPSEERP